MLYLLGVKDCWYLDYMKDLLLSLHIQVGKLTSVTTLLIYPTWYKTTDISHQTSIISPTKKQSPQQAIIVLNNRTGLTTHFHI